MTSYYDEVEIEDFEWDEDAEKYFYPCPCGDRFEISKEELCAGEDVATCPSCSLLLKVIYDPDQFVADSEEQVATSPLSSSVGVEIAVGGSD